MNPKRRVRPTLLVLLWIWALCVLVTLDLFLNLPALDGARPRATVYRAMRFAGHKMVGEPYLDGDFAAGDADRAGALPARSGGDEEADPDGDAYDGDVRAEAEALEEYARRFGRHSRRRLLQLVLDGKKNLVVRTQAARSLGLAGWDAFDFLEELSESEGLPMRVRVGAVLGLGDHDSRFAAEVALDIAVGPPSPLRAAALTALERMASDQARGFLIEAAGDPGREAALRAAACRTLGSLKTDSALACLLGILEDPRPSTAVRVAAADALGKLGGRDALGALEKACSDRSPAVARQARIARRRLHGGQAD